MGQQSNLTTGLCARASLRSWFSQGVGQRLFENEQRMFADQLGNLFGYHLVQVGRLSDLDLLASSRINQRCVLDFFIHDCGYRVTRAKSRPDIELRWCPGIQT